MSSLLDTILAVEVPLEKGASRHWIPSGDLGTSETISAMQKMVDTGKRSPRVRELAGSLIRDLPKKNYYAYAKAIFDFCRDKIQYAYDPHGVEWVESPERVLDAGIADCDSICVTFASLCENVGLPCQFVTIRADKSRPNEFSHVYARVKIPGKGWVGADCTMQHDFGWEPTGYELKTWPASSTDVGVAPEEISGLGHVSDFAAEDFDVDTVLPNELETAALCDTCPRLVATEAPASPFFIRQAPEQNMLAGLGEADASLVSIAQAVIDGDYRRELVTMRDTQRNRVAKLFELEQKAQTADKRALIAAARKANADALQKTNEAISKYNDAAGKIRTLSFGQIKPEMLSGMGALGIPPLALGALILAGGVALSTTLYALAQLVYAARGMEVKAKGIVEQLGDAIESSAGLVRNLVIAGIVGAVGYFGYKELKRRGKI
jgi:hypothetical protein